MDQAINACIVTFFMNNIDVKTVEYNKRVVEKFNKSNHPHYHVNTQLNHGASMDMFWTMNGARVKTFGPELKIPEDRFNHDVVMFLDVDCLPLNDEAIDFYIDTASRGKLIGNIQRSNHIQNNQHVFAAPNAVAMNRKLFEHIGKPSAIPTPRGDVGEEYTYAVEEHNETPVLIWPLRFEEAPAECPSWALKDGMPIYGRGTTFGRRVPMQPLGGGEITEREVYVNEGLFWHQFQSFHPGQQAKFWKKCEGLLNDST